MQKPRIAAVAMLFAAVAAIFYYNYTRPIHIIAVGDILLDRGVEKYLEESGYDYPYTNIKDVIARGDIAIGNLECPLTDSGNAVLKRPDLIFRGNTLNAAALKTAGFDMLNLANNHTMDQGRVGLESTIELLEDTGIRSFGAGKSRSEARKPVFIKKGSKRIGFLGYSDFPPEGYMYDEDKTDVARVDMKSLGEEVKSARAQCDFLVVSFHWGKEFDSYPGERQREMAHAAVDNGADIIVGHHPHVLQSMERYKDRLIFYSLGNFVFDKQLHTGTDESLIIDITVDGSGWKEARIVPVRIVDCKPDIAKGESAESILKKFTNSSKDYSVEVQIADDMGYVPR